ncbi:hypothetical protein BMETH_3715942062166, partial [methanotrophic bacterial endosymbiont of Bathymodiolus sp.]
KGLCASQLESDIREACVLGAKHVSDDKACGTHHIEY